MRKNLSFQNIPQHVAIIMDGNRRWAKKRGLPLLAGHRQAAQKTIEPLIEKGQELGVQFMTFWAFSTENWQREKKEVTGLLKIFRQALKTQVERLCQKGVRIKVIGDLSKFPSEIQKGVEEFVQKTQKNQEITVIFALNYGGRDEILRAISRLVAAKIKTRNLDEKFFSSFLDTAGLPDPDLIIRTGGERRLSGFLPWQGIYAELYFTPVLFPDFTPYEFQKAIKFYQKKERKFGA